MYAYWARSVLMFIPTSVHVLTVLKKKKGEGVCGHVCAENMLNVTVLGGYWWMLVGNMEWWLLAGMVGKS